MRESFRRDMEQLRNRILLMGNLVEAALDSAMTALKRRDLDLAEKVIENDEEIDQLELDIEESCLSLIALQQPAAGDLRFIGTALKINTDLERIGDHAVDIARIVLTLGTEPFIKPLIDLPRMDELARGMIRDNLKAYIEGTADLAIATAGRDHEIDHLYNQIFRELLVLMGTDPRNIKQSTHLLLIARYLERVGDHATNLSEAIVYMLTGNRLELNP